MALLSPFASGKSSRTVTKKHIPLIWECMLGTVYAQNPVTREIKYFDYDWEGARLFAQVSNCIDLRVSRAAQSYKESVRQGRRALFGLPPVSTATD